MARDTPPPVPDARLDFRSDTRTVPDGRMRAASALAEVGDDVYGDDPTVAALEARTCEILGTEAALFVPTGTMANLLAPLAAFPAPAGIRLIVGADSHMGFLEADGLRRFGGLTPLTVEQDTDGLLNPDHLEALLAAGAGRLTVVCLENTSMMRSGNALDEASTRTIADLTHRYGAHLHLDGARLAHAAVARGVPPATLAAPADSVAFSVSKALGAPIGALLGGSRAYVARARELRTGLGGSLHQSGVVAAPALVALGRLPELAADHTMAAALAAGLRAVPGVEVLGAACPTNMVMARVPGLTPNACAAALAARGVRVLPLPNGHVRFVTHRAHDMIGVREAVEALVAVRAAGAPVPARQPQKKNSPAGEGP